MISQQLLLSLQFPKLYDWKDYYVTSSNRDVIEWVQNFLSLDIFFLWVYGPPKSGKSYLGKLWAESINAFIFDDTNLSIENLEHLFEKYKYFLIDDACFIKNNEEWFFHFFDYVIRNNTIRKKVLILSNGKISDLDLCIKDLISRLKISVEVAIQNPDDDLIQKLIQKALFEYGIRCKQNEIKIIASNIERTYEGVMKFIDSLHEIKTKSGGSIIQVVKKILSNS